ncbi:MAG: hypothetical protein GTN64_08770, partial [Candidatus Latescibacteria bacterium]|nr:hypothetical protein [Candidatus Latescibacterota bacterium]NIO78691.1 hypothetical protein [Candidatus Latescibacterota bacterium]
TLWFERLIRQLGGDERDEITLFALRFGPCNFQRGECRRIDLFGEFLFENQGFVSIQEFCKVCIAFVGESMSFIFNLAF